MAPLAHAVRFIDGKQAQLALGVQVIQQAQKARRHQPLGRGVEQGQLAALQLPFHLLGFVVAERRIQERRTHPGFVQRTHLVVHQRDQRRHHNGHALSGLLAHDGGHLVAQAFATPGGHQHQRIAARHHLVHDGCLGAPEGGIAKNVLEGGQGGRQGESRKVSARCRQGVL